MYTHINFLYAGTIESCEADVYSEEEKKYSIIWIIKAWKMRDLLMHRGNKEQFILTENSEKNILLSKALSNWNTNNLKHI